MKDIFKSIKIKDDIPIYKYFVDGEWQTTGSKKKITLLSPIDSSILGRIQSVSNKEINIAIMSASLAQPLWGSTKLEQRTAILNKVAKLMKENIDILSEKLISEIGKPIKEAKDEIESSIKVIEDTIKETVWLKTETIKIKNEKCEIKRVPRGIIVCITPFNYPIYTSLTKIIPSLYTGNAVILKPSTLGSISVLYLTELFNQAGLPSGVLNIITGSGENLGKYLVSHRLINAISFTGSTKTAREITKRAGITKLLLELGGKDAAIVLKDADINKAAEEIADGAFKFMGQRCIAIKRVIVDSSIKDKLLKKLKEIIHKKYKIVGDPHDPKTQIGPVISDNQADYIASLLKDARRKGAKVVCGGGRLELCPMPIRFREKLLKIPQKVWQICRRKGRGRYFQTTILDNVKPNMKIAWEEQFGPILPILNVKNEKEAINLANASDYGLDVAIFSQSNKNALAVGEKIEVGQVFINSRPKRSPDQFPFTGVKDSGLDSEGIRYSLEAMTTLKTMRCLAK